MEYWVSLVFNVINMLALVLFYDAFMNRRYRARTFWALWALGSLFSFAVSNLVNVPISWLKLVIFTAFLFLFGMVLYQGSYALKILLALLFYAFLYLTSYLFTIASLSILHIDYERYFNDHSLYTIIAFGSNIAQLLLAALLKRIHSPQITKNPTWATFILLFPMTTLVLLVPLFSLFSGSEDNFSTLFVCITVMVIANFGILLLVDWLEQNAIDRESTLALSERMQAQEKNIEALSAAYSNQRKMAHDFQHHLSTLSAMLRTTESDQITQYLQQLQAEQSARLLLVNTHNAAIDAVLNQKAYAAQKLGIDIRFEVNDLSALKIKIIEITVVLGNLLDNAIEACQKLPQDKRWITVKMLHEQSGTKAASLFVSVVNSSPPVKIVDNHITTTKPDPSLHGFGLPNVQEILTRYNAEFVMQFENETFQFSLEWPDIAL